VQAERPPIRRGGKSAIGEDAIAIHDGWPILE
jgi:hypothetical protein